jgi:thiol-disulfide isomerase/thioredoxin
MKKTKVILMVSFLISALSLFIYINHNAQSKNIRKTDIKESKIETFDKTSKEKNFSIKKVEDTLIEHGFIPSFFLNRDLSRLNDLIFLFYPSPGKKPIQCYQPFLIEKQRNEPSKKNKKTIILHFWATWCGPCLLELPLLDKVSKRLSQKNIILPTCIDEDLSDINLVWETYKDHGVSKLGNLSTVSLSHNVINDLCKIFSVESIPQTVFLDQKGNMLGQIKGKVSWDDHDFLDALELFLEKPEKYFKENDKKN